MNDRKHKSDRDIVDVCLPCPVRQPEGGIMTWPESVPKGLKVREYEDVFSRVHSYADEAVAAREALAECAEVIERQDGMLRLACTDLSRDSKEWHEARDSEDFWSPEQFLADLARRYAEQKEADA